ncbi:MAG: MFS transporter [Arthrobacter sp.]|nr:MFS transporter [Arthrobacter sp.]MDZ4351409.1 MFS transporter [Arthrobacter sp.]
MVVATGVVAGTHIWKLPGALAQIQADTGMSLVAAGLLVALIQLASMVGGLLVAWSGEILGLRRLTVAGLLLLAIGSLIGSAADGASALMASRAVEGVGFLLCTVMAPALIQRSCAPRRINIAMASWGSFQGMATLIGLAASSWALQAADWRSWWVVMAAVALAPIPAVLAFVPKDPPRAGESTGHASAAGRRIIATVASPRPWIAGGLFACYTAQWMAIMGFLPAIYTAAGFQGIWPGLLSAAVGGVNAIGALSAGPLMDRGLTGRWLLIPAFATMAASSLVTFALPWPPGSGSAVAQVVGVAMFSLLGGLVPATMTRISVSLAPSEGSVTGVIGLMQQIFNVGNFVGPPMLAVLVTAAGGWHATWWMSCSLGALGTLLTCALLPRRGGRSPGLTSSRRNDPGDIDESTNAVPPGVLKFSGSQPAGTPLGQVHNWLPCRGEPFDEVSSRFASGSFGQMGVQ